jgi:hypothetical protein
LKKIVVLTLFVIFSLFQVFAQSKMPDIKKMLDTNHVRSNMEFLASDELEGREITERGQKIATLYIKTEFEKIGLKPVNGSYYQKMKVLKTVPPKSPRLIIDNGEIINLKFKEDFFVQLLGIAEPEVEADVVFAGYGITALDEGYDAEGYDDYKNIDVRGKIVLLLPNYPIGKGNNRLAKYREFKYKVNNAMEHGAIAVLLMIEKVETFVKSFGKFINQSSFVLTNDDVPSIPFALISKEMSDKVLKNSGWTTNAIKDSIDVSFLNKSFIIPKTSVKLKPDIKRTIEETENVVGLLEGSGSLKNEIVIVSGHYDHEGLDANGEVYNGADDNATGTTAVINVAKVMRQLNTQRSILFIAFTGEEKGLFGSRYYSQNWLFPIEKTHAAINIDMVGRYSEEYEKSDIKDYIYVIGPKIMGGDLPQYIEDAKKINNLHIDYKYDTFSDPNLFFMRSDHYVFAKERIPTVFFHSGEHKDYHKITDTVDKIEFSTFYKRLEMISYFTYLLCNSKSKIKIENAIP